MGGAAGEPGQESQEDLGGHGGGGGDGEDGDRGREEQQGAHDRRVTGPGGRWVERGHSDWLEKNKT